ncbi:hypothetical protein DEO72_LG9g1651 [Vigna unguiculata]|uniref:Uncharacterized protein n=1 Tax=Vigna unguiculata TaxID=3917 RepID=A0A4D6N3P0_VIGUN|nr:hypothetical protein DEO72_LG9g1651 [Vigna unguiculata]
MAMSHEDMLKRARQLKRQKTSTPGASPSAPPPPRIELNEEVSEPDHEALTRRSRARGKKVVESTSQHSTSQTPIAPLHTADNTELSFWHPQFLHSQHSRKHNYLRHDVNLLRAQDPQTLHENLLADLHKAEATSIMLMDQFNLQSTQKSLDLEQKDRALALSKTETSRLTNEVSELTIQVKKSDELIADLQNQLKVFETEKESWVLKEKDFIHNSELLKDQIGTSLNMGFQLALEQVRVLYPDADLSAADISKTVVDGQLVDIDD